MRKKQNAEKAASVMDINWSTTRSAMAQSAYIEQTVSVITMDRSTPNVNFRLSCDTPQSKLKLTRANVPLAEYILLFCADPEYFVTVNSARLLS